MARLIHSLAFFLLLLTQVFAETNYYLSIVDRTGAQLLTNPSTILHAPRKAVELTSLSWSAATPIDVATGQSTGRFRSTVFTVNRTADANSALILEQAITNALLQKVVITGYKIDPTGIYKPVQTYTLTNALVTSFGQGPITGTTLTEAISFSFQKFELQSGPTNIAQFNFNVPA